MKWIIDDLFSELLFKIVFLNNYLLDFYLNFEIYLIVY